MAAVAPPPYAVSNPTFQNGNTQNGVLGDHKNVNPTPNIPKKVEEINLTPEVLVLKNAFHVDQAIVTEENALVVIRFGSNDDILCQKQDQILEKCAKDIGDTWAVFYKVDNRGDGKENHVPDFNEMYELYDRVTVMFFYRNKHMMCDFHTGNNNKINWLLDDKDEMIDILQVIYAGARKGRGLVNSPKDYSTRHAY